MPSFTNTSDHSGHNFRNISSDFQSFRISALRKASRISDFINTVTIGPDAVVRKNKSWSENVENEQNNCNLNTSRKAIESPSIQQSPSSRSGITFSEKKIFLEEESQRREEVRKVMDKKIQHMEKSSTNFKQEIALRNEILAIKREKEEAAELARLEAEEEKLAQQNEIKRRHEEQLNAQRLQERKERIERETEKHRLERETEKHRLLKEREGLIQTIRNNLIERCRDVGMLSKSCKDKNSVSQMLGSYTTTLKELSQQMETLNEKARRGELSDGDIHFAEQIARQSEDVLNECAAEIVRIDELYDEEIARRQHEMNLAEANAQIQDAKIQQLTSQPHVVAGQMQQIFQSGLEGLQPVGRLGPETPPTDNASNTIETGATTTDSSSVETVIEEYDQENYQIYQRAKDLLNQYTGSPAFEQFSKASELKKFKFECQKAINLPVNTISAASGSHLLEKYNKLHQLLSGQSSLNINQHPQGPIYCKNLLAKNIVNQGETLVSSKSELAFGIAAVTVAMMCDFPDFAELLKAHFYVSCPYLVPYFPPRLQEQNDEKYYETLGYKYIDGQVEKQTKFLTRISGIMRLYATIIVTNRRRGVNHAHPLGLQTAWRWLASTINSELQPKFADVCATLILDMLEVVGNALWTAYPRQCPKLLILLRQHYYPQVQNCGGVGGGPSARLEKFLNDCISRSFIPPPEGQLPPNFW